MALRPKIYCYLKDNGHVGKKAKITTNCVIKRELKVEDYEIYLENNKVLLKTQQRFRNDARNLFTEKR